MTRGAYYNEYDPFAAQWLRNLMARGLIMAGDVDERPIQEVQPDDVRPYERVHLFAGIAGWDLALQLARWPHGVPVWTGSCPCQPFSAAGDGEAQADARHLWPEMFRLIRECGPDRVFGEQVAGATGFGWLDGVSADVEGEGYAIGAAVLGACSVGAPHIRPRLWWVANANGQRLPRRGLRPGEERAEGEAWSRSASFVECPQGTKRRTQSGLLPLAHGVRGRMGRIRAYGNAIVPQVAAAFIGAYMDCQEPR